MSILLHSEILENYNAGLITIEPFDEKQIGPNSYDVKISDTLKVYKFPQIRSCCENSNDSANNTEVKIYTQVEYLDPRQKNQTESIKLPKDGYVLKPGVLYLGSTMERIGSQHYLPMYEGRSSMARLGIQSHISAGFGDVGFESYWTLEIVVQHPVKIYPGMRVGQIYFHRINPDANNPENRYKGKYLVQKEPQESKSYEDF